MADIKKTVKLSYVAEGLDKLEKQMKNLRPFAKEKTAADINELEKRMQALSKSLDQDSPFSRDLAAGLTKELLDIAKKSNRIRIDVIKTISTVGAKEVEKLDGQIEELTKKAGNLSREVSRQEKRLTFDEKTGRSQVASYDQEITKQAAEKLGMHEQGMISFSGKEVKNADHVLQAFDKIKELLPDLSQGNRKFMEEVLETGKATGNQKKELDKIVKQLQNKNNLQLDSSQILQTINQRHSLEAQRQKIFGEEAVKLEEKKNDLAKTREQKEKLITLQKQRELELIQEAEAQGMNESQTKSLSEALKVIGEVLGTASTNYQELNRRVREYSGETRTAKRETDRKTTSMGKAASQVFNYGLAFTFLRRVYRETIRTVRDLDQALTEMAIVTTMSRKET